MKEMGTGMLNSILKAVGIMLTLIIICCAFGIWMGYIFFYEKGFQDGFRLNRDHYEMKIDTTYIIKQ